MMHSHDLDPALLDDLVGSARLIREFMARTDRAAFAADRMTVAAVEWQMTVMGLAAGRVSAITRDRLPEIGWSAIVRFADRLTREYRDVKPDEVWAVASESASRVVRVLDPAGPHDVEESEREQTQ
jgi:uncharacterized protein with HEPN domain